MSTWRGISHARTTKAMERALSPAEFKVVATARRLIPDGQRRRISQERLARLAQVSEGTVSRTMRKVDGIFFRRHPLGAGRGRGFEIEALPPPEQLQIPLGAPEKGSLTDPSPETFADGSPTPQTPPEKGSLTDPSHLLDHAHEQQQQRGGADAEADRRGGPPQLAPETVAALEQRGAHPKLIRRIAEANPGCTVADIVEAELAAQLKPSAHTPPGLAFEALARRQKVVAPRTPAEPPLPDEPRRPRAGRRTPPGEVVDPAAARAWLAEQGLLDEPPPDEPAPRREPWRPPTPYYGAEPPPERVAGQPPPVSPRPLIPQRPPAGERRLGPLAELGREQQRKKFRRGGPP